MRLPDRCRNCGEDRPGTRPYPLLEAGRDGWRCPMCGAEWEDDHADAE